MPRWAARASDPMSPQTAPVARPSAGWIEVARNVASTGPTMKTTSSTTASQAKAVLSRVVPRSRCVHRARTQAPAEEKPSPTPAAAARVLASGQSCSTLVINTTRLALLIKVAVTSTRAWPIRSIRRPQAGAATAPVMVPTAVTSPARPNEPVTMETSNTMPSPVIDSGSRATKPATVKARADGSASTLR